MYAKALRHDGREYAEKKTIPETGQTRHKAKKVWVDDTQGADLSNKKDGAGDD